MMLSVWTDGIQSNLLSEFCGFLLSMVATYLIFDRLSERNRKRHFAPLKRSLLRAVGQNLAALAHLWAFTLDKASGSDLEKAIMERDLDEVVRDLTGRVDADLKSLFDSAELRAAFIARSQVEPDELARETVEDVTGIGEVVNRVGAAILDDIELESMLADLTADARALDHVRSFGEYLENVKRDQPPLDLMVLLSIRCYRRTQAVWEYMQKLEEERR